MKVIMEDLSGETIKSNLREKALELGFSEMRICAADAPDAIHNDSYQKWIDSGMHGDMGWIEKGGAKRLDPQLILSGAQSVIVVAFNYSPESGGATLDTPAADDGVIARYAQASDYHDFIGDRLKSLSQYLDALTGVNSRSLWYVDTGPILERSFAQRSGLGFAGKHTNLISKKLGNWFFVAEIITQALLPFDEGEVNRCGKCEACIDACPTGAIPRPFVLDARRCISYLTIEYRGSIPEELRPQMGQRIFGCDDCLAACPWNRFAKESREIREFMRPDLINPSLREWLAMDDPTFRTKTRGTPLFRTRRNRFLRNVCIAMGNSGNTAFIPDLQRASQDPDPLIAEHALWAINQLENPSQENES